MELPLRHQGVLVTAMRGCDGAGKEVSVKHLLRELRGLVLVPFDVRELDYKKGFITAFDPGHTKPYFDTFIRDEMEALPMHFVTHLMHAIQVVAYHCPFNAVREVYHIRYHKMASRFHLRPEHKAGMDERLTEDRICRNNVEA